MSAEINTPVEQEKPLLILLCHRIPYPPDKGDKIRSFNLLKYLDEHYRVALGAFIDEDEDLQYRRSVERWCHSCKLIRLSTRISKIKSVGGLFNNQALSIAYYANAAMDSWIDELLKAHEKPLFFAFSTPMAQYANSRPDAFSSCIVDLVDIDSQKWLKYAEQSREPMKWIYHREAVKLFEYEQALVRNFDRSYFVSSAEAATFEDLAPELRGRARYYNNGVNFKYFSPDQTFENPYKLRDARNIVFTGAMDYKPNIDAVTWFATSVLESLTAGNDNIHFYIVGSNPSNQVRNLSRLRNVTVTGRVPDIRPYLTHADVAVAPMEIARGIQNKVLEAMAMRVPLVVSSAAMVGIPAKHECELIVADTVAEYRTSILAILSGAHEYLGGNARALIEKEFSWGRCLSPLAELSKL